MVDIIEDCVNNGTKGPVCVRPVCRAGHGTGRRTGRTVAAPFRVRNIAISQAKACGYPLYGVPLPIQSSIVKGFAPVLKLNLDNDTNRQIVSIEVIWFVLNDTEDGYDLVTDTSVLKYLISSANIELSDSNFTRRKLIEFNPASESIFTLSPLQVWYYNKPEAPEGNAPYIHVAYESGGVGFMFAWSAPD